MAAQVIPLLARRRIEAEVLAHVHQTLCEKFGDEVAQAVLARAVEKAAELSGREFAAEAPTGPCLAHFAEVLQRWRRNGALEVEDEELSATRFTFVVTRCGYAELYRGLALPADLAYTLSCRRDAAFARGYDPALTLERSATIAEGSPACRFCFRWAATQAS